ARQVLRGNADTGVSNVDRGLACVFGDGDSDVASRVRVLRAVGEQVAEDLCQPDPVGVDVERLGGHLHVEPVSAGVESRAAGFYRALDGFPDSRDLLAQLQAVAGDPADIQQVVDETDHLARLPLHDSAGRIQCRVDAGAALEQSQTVAE